MEQRRSGNNAGKNALDCVDLQLRIKIGERAVGKNQAEIKTDERAAASKNKTHKSADILVFFDPVAVVNPNQREVLHVVKNLKQRNTDEQIGDAVIAIPPKADARDQQREFYRVSSLGMLPTPSEIGKEQDRNRNGEKKQSALRDLKNPRLNEGPATGVKHG